MESSICLENRVNQDPCRSKTEMGVGWDNCWESIEWPGKDDGLCPTRMGSSGGLPTFEHQTRTCSERIELRTMHRRSRDQKLPLAIMQLDLCFLFSLLLVPLSTLTHLVAVIHPGSSIYLQFMSQVWNNLEPFLLIEGLAILLCFPSRWTMFTLVWKCLHPWPNDYLRYNRNLCT